MADTRISNLTQVATPALTDVYVVVQDGTTKKITLEQISDLISGGKVLYKARITQTGTDAPTLTEFINNTGETITASRTNVGTYVVTGFNGQLDTDCVITFDGNGIDQGESVKIFSATGDNNFAILTYDNANSLADDVLNVDTVGLFYFNSITVTKYPAIVS